MSGKRIFRKSVLDRLSSPEQLDKLITVTSTRSWIFVVNIAAILIFVIAWGIFGSIPVKVQSPGILISSSGTNVISSTVNGQVTDVRVNSGDVVKKGEILAILGESEIVDNINNLENVVSVLGSLTPNTNWDSITLPTELLEFQALGQKVKSARQNVSASSVDPKMAEKDYTSSKKLYEAGAISETEMDKAYSKYMSAMSNYNQQSLTENQYIAEFNSTKKARLEEYGKQAEDHRKSLENQYTIIAPMDCKITSIKVSKGDVVAAGSQLAGYSPIGSNVKALQVVAYVPISDAKKVKVGMEVKVYPSTIKKEEYGYMKGTVIEVPELPATGESLIKTLGNETLASQLTSDGTVLEVVVDLIADESTASGYQWSGKKGGTVEVENGTVCSIGVVVKTKAPIEMVIPILKEKYLPIE